MSYPISLVSYRRQKVLILVEFLLVRVVFVDLLFGSFILREGFVDVLHVSELGKPTIFGLFQLVRVQVLLLLANNTKYFFFRDINPFGVGVVSGRDVSPVFFEAHIRELIWDGGP